MEDIVITGKRAEDASAEQYLRIISSTTTMENE